MTHKIRLSIAPDHPAYAGHFPDKPILPGVVLLDEALVAIGAAIGRDAAACQISSVKFLSPIAPGEPVDLEFAAQENGAIRFDLFCDTRKVATGAIRVAAA